MYKEFDYQLMNELSFKPVDLEWTMVNVNSAGQKGDAHVITTNQNKHILIDAGQREMAEQRLLPFLEKRGIRSFDIVFISHAHKDHYGGLDTLLDHGVGINEVYFDMPDRKLCDREIPWGCDYLDILRIHQKLNRRGIIVNTPRAGQSFQIGQDSRLEVLYAFGKNDSPVPDTDINDLSLIMRLCHNGFRFLFTGDLNYKIGEYLATCGDDISADVLKVPHHAIEDLAPNSFFRKVNPRYALISTPDNLWKSNESARVKKWFRENDIPVFVSGVAGNVRALIDGDELRISAEL